MIALKGIFIEAKDYGKPATNASASSLKARNSVGHVGHVLCPTYLLIGMVESERHRGDSVTVERRYYLASLADDAVRFGHAVRSHWSIENPLHWSLDVTFNENACRVRQGKAAENFAVLRHIALSLLRQEKTAKGGLETKRFKAALEIDYLYKVLNTQM
ncbi:MAG: ISAs1 family transposase [Candidatus Competibacteraceae bacterium]